MSETISSPRSAAPEPLGTFARAIIVETSGHFGWRTLDCAISLAIHVVTIGALCILPVFFLAELHPHMFGRAIFVSMIPPASGSLETRPAASHPAAESGFEITRLLGPITRPGNAFAAPPDPVPPPVTAPPEATSVLGNPLVGVPNNGPLVIPGPQPSDELILVGGSLTGSQLIRGFSLAYPAIARMAHVFGEVVIEAIIDESGSVRRVRAVSGPELLAVPALQAVSRERFEPSLLDGRPIPRDLTVVVNFRLF